MVALKGNVHICNECVDLMAEIVHEDGCVTVSVRELEELRKQARQSNYASHWLDMVRNAVAQADARVKELACTADGVSGTPALQPFTFHWLVELRPAFDGHPHFEATYYAGWLDVEPAKTRDPLAAARFARKEDAERVAEKLGHTLSCVWKAVEHGFASDGVALDGGKQG